MRPTFVNLTEKQFEYLRAVKQEHGISYSAYIRTLLMKDMLGGSRSDSAPIFREDKIIKTLKVTTIKTIRTESTTAQWLAIQKEIKPILTKRRVIVDKFAWP